MSAKAVFLDRDGTLMVDTGYPSKPEDVRLLPGVDLALKSLRQGGFRIVVITNQSGVARGMFTEHGLAEVHRELRRQLEARGAYIDAIYYCPYHPDGTVAEYTRESDCRKPAPGMLLMAAEEMDLDLVESWMVGDSPRDVEAGQRAGCRTIRLRTRAEADQPERVQADFTVRNLVDAARVIMREAGQPVRPADTAADRPAPPDRQETVKAGAQPGTSGQAARPATAASASRTEPAQPETNAPTRTSEPASPRDEDIEAMLFEESAGSAATAKPTTPTDTPARKKPTSSATNPAPAGSAEAASPTDRPLATHEQPITEGQMKRTLEQFRRELFNKLELLSGRHGQQTFSVTKLVAGLSQGLAGVGLLVTLILLFSGASSQATVWGLVAVVFQVMSLSFYLMARES